MTHPLLVSLKKWLAVFWTQWLTPLLLLGWVSLSLLILLRRHDTFRTAVFDQGFYTHVIWNTAQGDLYVNRLPPKPPLILGDHFSPALGFIAPIFWVFPDARVLLAVKVVSLAVTLLPAYLLVKARYPLLAPCLTLAFVFSPTLYQTVLDKGDFHEIVLAAPTVSLALYALLKKRKLLLCLALGLTLVVREDMGVYVAAFGLYLLWCVPEWRKLGLGLMAAGAGWVLVTTQFLVPLSAGSLGYIYVKTATQQNPILGRLLQGDVTALWLLPQLFFSPEKLQALFRFFFPLGGLPLLAAGEQWLWLGPTLFLLAVLSGAQVGAFSGWYLSPLIPLAWYATAATLARAPARWAASGVLLLLVGTGIGLYAWRDAPLVSHVDAQLYPLTEHDRIGHQVVRRIPPDAAVMAQDGLGVHLATRAHFGMFPWAEAVTPQWIVLDAQAANTYPLSREELLTAIQTLQLDPTIHTQWEQDGYFVFLRDGQATWQPRDLGQWESGLVLNDFEIAQMDATGAFGPTQTMQPGRQLRLMLYWTFAAPLPPDHKISVVLTAPDGFILAQNDGGLGQGVLDTTTITPGQTIRDTHYLTLPPGSPAAVTVQVIVYNAVTMERLPPAEGVTLTKLPVAEP